ncbi:MAG: nucleotidyltransferase family protein [Chromatiales bacterium]|nr:nucleotidyltransferase family protein [Chromatiales bacterium]
MPAMILAAGRGERLRPLTDTTPKPLIEAGGRSLIEHHLSALANYGFTRIVINHAYLGAQIEARLGDGTQYGVHVIYSREGTHALETGGGIHRALPLLGEEVFVIVNADIWTDFPFATLTPPRGLAHLVLAPNPPHHPRGDFALKDGIVSNEGAELYTYTGIAVLRAELFASCTPGAFPLAPLLRTAITRGEVSGELYRGAWRDIGTPESLRALREWLGESAG